MSEDLLSNLPRVIDQVSKDKGIERQIVVNSIVQGVLTAIRKKYGTYRDIEVKFSEETGEIEIFEFKKVVPDKDFEDELIEIKLSEARKLDPEAQIEEQIGTQMALKDMGRVDAQAARQIIIQGLRSAENEIIFNEFEKRKGEIAHGVVRRAEPGMIVVDLDKTEAYIPRREQIPGEVYKSGDRIQGYLLEARQTTRGPQIIMSRAHEQYLIKLFEAEVPEVYEGIVKIVGAAREPGQRAKMAVYSVDPAVHPVGACVGVKGSRVQNITQELKGERIDVIVWDENPVQFVCEALQPAKILKALVDEENKQMQVIIPDDQLSLAIGKKGQNVRLAVKLTGWQLNLTSEQEARQKKQEALFNLSLISDMTQTEAQSLFEYGFLSLKEISEAGIPAIQSVPGFEDRAKAQKLILSAREVLRKHAEEGKELPKFEEAEKEKQSVNLKEQAEEILRRELAQLDKKKEEEAPAPDKAPETEAEKPKTAPAPDKAPETAAEKPKTAPAPDKAPETAAEKPKAAPAPDKAPETEAEKPKAAPAPDKAPETEAEKPKTAAAPDKAPETEAEKPKTAAAPDKAPETEAEKPKTAAAPDKAPETAAEKPKAAPAPDKAPETAAEKPKAAPAPDKAPEAEAEKPKTAAAPDKAPETAAANGKKTKEKISEGKQN